MRTGSATGTGTGAGAGAPECPYARALAQLPPRLLHDGEVMPASASATAAEVGLVRSAGRLTVRVVGHVAVASHHENAIVVCLQRTPTHADPPSARDDGAESRPPV